MGLVLSAMSVPSGNAVAPERMQFAGGGGVGSGGEVQRQWFPDEPWGKAHADDQVRNFGEMVDLEDDDVLPQKADHPQAGQALQRQNSGRNSDEPYPNIKKLVAINARREELEVLVKNDEEKTPLSNLDRSDSASKRIQRTMQKYRMVGAVEAFAMPDPNNQFQTIVYFKTDSDPADADSQGKIR